MASLTKTTWTVTHEGWVSPSPHPSAEGTPDGEAGGVGVCCSRVAAASGKGRLSLQVCAAHAGDHEAEAGVGDEAEQDTDDEGKRPSKCLPRSSRPDGQRFLALTCCACQVRALWERSRSQCPKAQRSLLPCAQATRS